MPTYTRAEILAKIAEDITTNGAAEITGAVLKGVLDYMVGEAITPTQIEIPATDEIEMLEGITTLDAALIEIAQKNVPVWTSGMVAKAGYMVHHLGYLYYLKNDVDSGDTDPPATDTTNYERIMTGAQMVASLEALTGADMLDATKVYADYGGASTVQAAITALKTLADGAVQDTGNETVAGVKTFSSFPVTPSSAPTTDYQTANKKYVDDSINTGSQVIPAALDIDWSAGRHFYKARSAATTLTFSNLVDCKEIKLEYHATGLGAPITWPDGCIVTGTITGTGDFLITMYCASASAPRVYVRIEQAT